VEVIEMLGAIAGDIIGSVYESNPIKTIDFPLFSRGSSFTDDTVLTVALADCILHGADYTAKLKEYFSLYPRAGYGGMFYHWASSNESRPYNSFGNGSAMRVSPAGYAFDTLEETLEQAERSAAVTHNHPEGIKGAQATAAAIFLARQGRDKVDIKEFVEAEFAYDLSEPLHSIRQWYHFDVTCQGSIPQAIIAFLESESYESAVRNAISLGGDSDTQACITGGIAQAFYGGVPRDITDKVLELLDDRLREITVKFMDMFYPGWLEG
jgi:ADP-ribosylglycohydrolase